jgi:hypothetical protein
MKKDQRDEDAFEDRPRGKRPARQDDEPPRRKVSPPVDEGRIEEEDRPSRRARSRREEDEDDRPRSRSRYEEEDDEDNRSRRRSRGRDDEEAYSTLIPYRNATALIGYYCGMGGLVSILGGIALVLYNIDKPRFAWFISLVVIYGLGGITALLGIIFGIIGLVYANKNPKSRGMGHAITGMVLGILEILGLVAILLIGLLAFRR